MATLCDAPRAPAGATGRERREGSAQRVASGELSQRARWSPPGLDTLFTGLFALIGWGVGIQQLSDNSFFWHLRTGRLILDAGLPHADPFSYTAAGTRWVGQSWLAELAYGVLDRLAGPFGIRVFGGLIAATITVLVFRLALRLTRERVRAGLLSVAAVGGLYTLWSTRPLVLGALLLVVLLWIVEVPDSWVGRHARVTLPAVFWLWANVHGSFALGFAFLGLHLLGRWLDGHRPWEGMERSLALGGALGFLATFANPYGFELVTFPADLLARSDVLRKVVEWSSPDFHTIRGQVFALWMAVFLIVVAKARHRLSRRDLVVTLPFVLLALWALRNVVITPLVCLPVAARAVRCDNAPHRSESRLKGAWLVAGALAMITVGIGVRAASRPDFMVQPYPVQALRVLEERGLLGRHLLTDDADSGYVILEYWPRQRVFFDDRFDMYPRRIFDDFVTVSEVRPGWHRVLERHDVEVVIWDRRRALAQVLRAADDWRVVHHDSRFVLFVRRDVLADSSRTTTPSP